MLIISLRFPELTFSILLIKDFFEIFSTKFTGRLIEMAFNQLDVVLNVIESSISICSISSRFLLTNCPGWIRTVSVIASKGPPAIGTSLTEREKNPPTSSINFKITSWREA